MYFFRATKIPPPEKKIDGRCSLRSQRIPGEGGGGHMNPAEIQ